MVDHSLTQSRNFSHCLSPPRLVGSEYDIFNGLNGGNTSDSDSNGKVDILPFQVGSLLMLHVYPLFGVKKSYQLLAVYRTLTILEQSCSHQLKGCFSNHTADSVNTHYYYNGHSLITCSFGAYAFTCLGYGLFTFQACPDIYLELLKVSHTYIQAFFTWPCVLHPLHIMITSSGNQ